MTYRILPTLAALALSALGLAGPVQAETLHATAAGTRLSIDSPCARQVTIAVDPSLTGQAVLDATADHQEEIQLLNFAGGEDAVLKLHGDECYQPTRNFEPTLVITLRVPAGFPVAIDDSGSAEYRVGATGADLKVDGSGSMTLTAESVSALSIDASGSGQYTVAKVAGPVEADISGSADITIKAGASPAVALEASGSGAFAFASGTIGRLKLDSSGSARIAIGAVVRDGAMELSGSGDVVIARVTGNLAQDISGSASVKVLER